MAGTKGSTLVLGEPDIKVKVCVGIKRLLIVALYTYIYIRMPTNLSVKYY